MGTAERCMVTDIRGGMETTVLDMRIVLIMRGRKSMEMTGKFMAENNMGTAGGRRQGRVDNVRVTKESQNMGAINVVDYVVSLCNFEKVLNHAKILTYYGGADLS